VIGLVIINGLAASVGGNAKPYLIPVGLLVGVAILVPWRKFTLRK
jgi:hypothetical protein